MLKRIATIMSASIIAVGFINSQAYAGQSTPKVVGKNEKTVTRITIPPKKQKLPPRKSTPKKSQCTTSWSLENLWDFGEITVNDEGLWEHTKNVQISDDFEKLTMKYYTTSCPGQRDRVFGVRNDKTKPDARATQQKVETVAKTITSTMALPKPTPGMALMNMPQDHVGNLPTGTPYALVNGAY